jgi:phosphate transport system permease protein
MAGTETVGARTNDTARIAVPTDDAETDADRGAVDETPRDTGTSRVQVRAVSAADAYSLGGAVFGALGLVWVLYERVLPLSGALGFWVCCYAGFLLIYAGVCSTQWPGRFVIDKLVRVIVASAGLIVLAIVLDQIGYVVLRGWDAIGHSNFFSQTMALAGPLDPLTSGGMVHALVGSLEQMAISTVIAVPLGVFAALFLVEVGGPMARPVRTIVEAMTALPEIIAGLFIYAFAILSLGLDPSGFAAALALTVMMIPIVTRSSEVILRLVPGGLREASYALGASQARTVFTIVLPTARSGLATAVILAMARAIGETSPVLLTAGFTSGMNTNPFSGPQVSLPLYIYTYVRFPQQTMVSRAFGAGLALMLMVLALFALARFLGGKDPGELTRRQRRRMQRDARRKSAATTDRPAKQMQTHLSEAR